MAATVQAKAELQKSVRRAKDKVWKDSLKILIIAEVWREAKFSKQLA